MAIRSFESVEFVCPHCGRTHNVKEFLRRNLNEGKTSLDTEYSEEMLFENYGQVRLSFPYCECDCGQHFIMDFEDGYCIIYDDMNGIVAEEGYNCTI